MQVTIYSKTMTDSAQTMFKNGQFLRNNRLYFFPNKKLNSTTINLQYVGGNSSSEDDVITFDGQGTGVVATVESKIESIAYRTHAFLSVELPMFHGCFSSSLCTHQRCTASIC